MAGPIVESGNGRFFLLLALSAGAIIAWYAFRGEFSIDISRIDPLVLLIPLAIGAMIIRGIVFITNHVPTEPIDDEVEEPTGTDRTIAEFEPEGQAPMPDPTPQWSEIPERDRAQILGWIAIFLGFFFYPIGPIIGLILIRKFSGSTIVTVARVLLILSLVLPLFFIIPVLMIALNPSP